jgi:uncharacterized protein with NAD-binding domain and iron-sulfur cluster
MFISGGGISGLSVDHDISNKGFGIELYEKNDVYGDHSLSIDYGRYYSEYSWRIYCKYYNFYRICKEIKTKDGAVLDNFVPLGYYLESNLSRFKDDAFLNF